MGDKIRLNMLEIRRQLLHIFVGFLTLSLIMVGVLSPLLLFLIIVLCSILSVLARWQRLPVVSWFLENFEREKQREKFPGKGFISFFVGVLLAVKLFEPSIAYAAIMVLTLGDSVSHMIGIHLGRIRNPLNGIKSIEGNLAGGLAGFMGAVFFVSPGLAVVGSFGAMLVEAIQIKMNEGIVDDNIIVPLVAGALITVVKNLWVF
jgi:dolichol kinase